MAQNEASNGRAPNSRPSLTHRISSISDISSPSSTPDPHLRHHDSEVSLQSISSERHASRSMDELDVSHVRLSTSGLSAGSSGIASPAEGSNRQSRLSMLLPETPRAGPPTSPSSRGFNPFSRNMITSYEPISPGESSNKSQTSRSSSNRYLSKRKSSLLAHNRHGSIPEEEIDWAQPRLWPSTIKIHPTRKLWKMTRKVLLWLRQW